MKTSRRIALLLLLPALAAALAGCNLMGGDDTPVPAAAPTVNAPLNAAAWNGVTLEFNPRISFGNGTFSYTNATAGAFPADGGAALPGTFAWTPNADRRGGTLALTFNGGAQAPLSFTLSSFLGGAGRITGMSLLHGNTVYPAVVADGTLVPADPPPAPTGGTGTNGTTTTLPESFAGSSLTLTLTTKAQLAPAGFPYNEGDTELFVFSSSSMLFVGKGYPQRELGLPHRVAGNSVEYFWRDTANDFTFALSFLNGQFHEINVYSDDGANGTPAFYGQFTNEAE